MWYSWAQFFDSTVTANIHQEEFLKFFEGMGIGLGGTFCQQDFCSATC
jgi:hypothetical protein